MYWEKLSLSEIKDRVFKVLNDNINYRSHAVLGVPGTFLDPEEFYPDAPFLENSPFLSTLIANPNHIGCHTLTGASGIFAGTQQMEIELIRLCAEEIFNGEPEQQDGYVAPGGTEANIQAMWIYRNYFKKEFNAQPGEIGLVYSEDSHYSMPKGADLLGLASIVLPVDDQTRSIVPSELESRLKEAAANGIRYFIIVMNMSTTMFGSVDDIDLVTSLLEKLQLNYRLHVDAAFGGFIYPFTNPASSFSFKNPHITSITIDAHKMLQTPYGTGIFLVRKGWMQYVCTEEAQYVPGKDYTLCGSRSGANAISVWMIMKAHGSEGWKVKMKTLTDRTTDLCKRLDQLNVKYYRNPFLNIVAIRAGAIPIEVAEKYLLVADTYECEPKWWKIVMMPHITRGLIDAFLNDLKAGTAR